MTEPELHRALAQGVIGVGGVVFVALFAITAPYGRHARSGLGPLVSSRAGWLLMESPAVLAFLAIYLAGKHAFDPAPALLAALWLLHYVHRAFVYPLRLGARGKPMPLAIPLLGILFNLVNAYLNARWLSELGDYPLSFLRDPRPWLGAVVFLTGLAVNVHSDGILLALRGPGEQGYEIPRGGAFRWLSAPNYAAEVLEWSGWALATWSLAGLAFALFTFANLAPRAVAHHRWYRETFPEYPASRKALVPFVW